MGNFNHKQGASSDLQAAPISSPAGVSPAAFEGARARKNFCHVTSFEQNCIKVAELRLLGGL
jgi:hypothetical protein